MLKIFFCPDCLTISYESSYVKNHFFGLSRGGGVSIGLSFFFLSCLFLKFFFHFHVLPFSSHLLSSPLLFSSLLFSSLLSSSRVARGCSLGGSLFCIGNNAHSEKVCSSPREKGEPRGRLPHSLRNNEHSGKALCFLSFSFIVFFSFSFIVFPFFHFFFLFFFFFSGAKSFFCPDCLTISYQSSDVKINVLCRLVWYHIGPFFLSLIYLFIVFFVFFLNFFPCFSFFTFVFLKKIIPFSFRFSFFFSRVLKICGGTPGFLWGKCTF